MGLFQAIKLILTLKCEQSARLVSDSLDRELGLAERWAVRGHHLGCRSCRRLRQQLLALNEAARVWSDGNVGAEPLDWSSAKERIAAALKDAQS